MGLRDFWSVRVQVRLLGAVTALLLGALLAGDALVLRSARDRFDREDEASTLRRARVAIEQGQEADRRRLTESAWWDEAYDYMGHHSDAGYEQFLKDNFTNWLPEQYGDRFIGFYDVDRQPRFRWHDALSGELDAQLPATTLFDLLDQKGSAAGYLALGGRIVIVTGAQVLPGGGAGPGVRPHGYLVTMRPVNDTTARQLEQALQQRVSLRSVIPARDTVIRMSFSDGDSVATRFLVADLFGRHTVLLELRASRDFLARVEAWMSRSFALAVILGALTLGFLGFVATHFLLRPFTRIDRQFARMREEGRIGNLASVSTAREWSLLVESFNQLADARERAERALAEARDEAVAATEAKSQFLANMSHEIRTPMNAILGLSDLLRKTAISPEQRRYVDAVHGSGESLLALVNDILDLSKVEAGKIEVETIPFDLNRAAQETIAMFTARAAERGVGLETLLAPDLPTRVLGDPGRVRQVLTNLVGNALKFTREGAVRVRVRPEGKPEDGVVAFEIEDTGVGIPADKLDKIFEKYAQVDASTTRKFGGTGLGLAISRQLVELMGGRLSVRSQPGKGSVFAFALPLPVCSGVPAQLPRNLPLAGVRALQIWLDGSARSDHSQPLLAAGLRLSELLSAEPPAETLLTAVAAGDPVSVIVIEAEEFSLRLQQAIAACRRDLWPTAAIAVRLERGARGDAGRVHATGAHVCLFEPVAETDLIEAIAVARQVVQGGLSWPLITRHWLIEARHAEEDGPVTAGARPLRPMRVLVTDDNELNRLVASEYLRRLGCEVETAASGFEAVQRVGQGGVDLVFMDCQMPEIDGYETTRRIRELLDGPGEVPIVAMTANAMQGDRDRCLAAGMNDFVSKPVRENDLSRMLRRWAGSAAAVIPATGPGRVTAKNEPPAVEDSVLAGLMASGPGGASLAGRLVTLFLRDAPAQVVDLGLALTRNDAPLAGRLAHTLRGSAGVIGAPGIRDLCALIEHAAQRGAMPDAWAGHARLEREAQRVTAALREAQSLRGNGEALDPATVAEFRRMEAQSPGLLAEMTALFLRDAPLRLTELEVALARGDAEAVRHAAHTLKGAALQLGAAPLGQVAAELEQGAKTGDLRQAGAGLARLLGEFERARTALGELTSEVQASTLA